MLGIKFRWWSYVGTEVVVEIKKIDDQFLTLFCFVTRTVVAF